jgi:hypothetical protein
MNNDNVIVIPESKSSPNKEVIISEDEF